MTSRGACALFVGVWVAVTGIAARAASPAPHVQGADNDDGFDDPKLAREATAQAAVVAAHGASPVTPKPIAPPAAAVATTPAKPPPAAPAVASTKPAPAPVAPAASDHAVANQAAPAHDAPEKSAGHPAGGDLVARASPTAAADDDGSWSYTPLLKLSYSRFPFSRIAAAAPASGSPGASASTSESFESVALDIYPMSDYLRVGLSSQFGWESGQFDRSGDYFLAQSTSVGFQLPWRFTPFIEGIAGGGYMRRRQTSGTLPTVYWQTGIDAGVEVYVRGRAYVSVALGYLHAGNLFVMDSSLNSMKVDTWSLKIGVGI